MSDWQISEEDDDFLAAPSGAINDTDDINSEIDPDEWTPAQGFPDEHEAVRVWADEDGVMVKVRVALDWREKVAKTSLMRSFNIAFMAMSGYYRYRVPDSFPQPEIAQLEPPTTKFSAEILKHYQEENLRLLEEIKKLPPRKNFSRYKGEGASASDFEDGVTVYIDKHGYPTRAVFDQEWLDGTATSSQIAKGVMNCYRRARAKWQPAEVVFDEHDILHAKAAANQRQLLLHISNGIEI